ncbi:family 78 glycoside hydrolase catalytic domain [Streptomyces acidicola]|uniref:family 78 glycoside hydrolase catalytic domain n=1 Tax=Streptomyces acidicola TaxID=2596892 RepID=UPI0037A4647B
MTSAHQPAVSHVRAEHHRRAFGIGQPSPRLSWSVDAPQPGWRQTAYEIEVRDSDNMICTSGRIDSPEQVLVPWPGKPLASRQQCQVRVRVWGEDGQPSAWSPDIPVEAGLQSPQDWTAAMIGPAGPPGGPMLMRTTFRIDGDIARARLYITAHGLYEAEINGRPVSDDVLAPGWTSYAHRLRYQTYDVTGLVRTGANALGATLADGWYRGRLAWTGMRDVFGDRLGLMAQLVVTLTDGRTVTVTTDDTWKSAPGPVQQADLYDGETYDARLELPDWSQPSFDDTPWAGVGTTERDPATLVAPDGPPMRRTQTVPVAEVLTTPSGATVLDFGQNLVGRLRITVRGPRGTTVRLRHAEVLENGELGVRPLRSAKATDVYILRGDPAGETYEPRFTFHGFRYAEVTGWPGILDSSQVEAVVLHSDMEPTGSFACSDPLLSRFHDNVLWGMRGNFVDVPTDCPQRDERLGWTGDIQVFAPTAAYLYDCAGFLTSWLKDLAADQTADGNVPVFIPDVPVPGPTASDLKFQTGWGDAAVLVPWTLYERYGDIDVLRHQYSSMCHWMDGVSDAVFSDNLLQEPHFQLGDWLDPSAPPENPAAAATDPYLVATAYWAHTAKILADIATLLDQEADAARYGSLASDLRTRFTERYVTETGRLTSDSQTAYALALQFELLDSPATIDHARKRLVELVRENGHRIGTGFLGTPLICDALVGAGALDDAYRMLRQTECPSWLYSVAMGATTIWERWDSMLPDGTINPGEMTSFNHYALGAVADWMHRFLGGLAPAAPGYRRFTVAPRPTPDITWADTSHRTPYGDARVFWRQSDEDFTLDITVPVGTRAEVLLPRPDATPTEAGPGRHTFHCARQL